MSVIVGVSISDASVKFIGHGDAILDFSATHI